MKYEKRCSQCNLIKSWSLFTYKNGDLLDICKECEMFNFLKKNSDNLSKEAQNLYLEAYVEGFNKSTSTLYYKKKDDANQYAKSMFPELGEAISQSAKRARDGSSGNPELAKIGDSLKARLARLQLRKKYLATVSNNENGGNNEMHKKNGYEMYKNWVNENDFVAKDNLLSFFSGMTSDSFSSARLRLAKNEGYEFNKVENGWQVTKRPETKQQEEPILTEDELKVLKSLLGKLNGLIK